MTARRLEAGRVNMLALAMTLMVCLALTIGFARAAPVGDSDFPWQAWDQEVFDRAKAENKFVLLSLQSWWCPWCHTMNEETFENEEVRAYIDAHYIPVRVDQDSRPDISQRYERWGWPATVLFGPDGTEIVKLRGFYSAKFFLPILKGTIDDPSPIEYGQLGGPEQPAEAKRQLAAADHDKIIAFMNKVYDDKNGGWGKRKFIDGPTLIYALSEAKAGDMTMARRARQTVSQLINLVDFETGAVSQVSVNEDWSEPFREFPMFAQEAGLTAFSIAYALYGDAEFRQAADRVYNFLSETLTDPDGGFYASMGLERGQPGIDRNRYARENGMAISAVLAYYDATGDDRALALAEKAANWVIENRGRSDGGFNHAVADGVAEAGGPYIVDSLHMGRALLRLHRSTGERHWLQKAMKAADFVLDNFVDAETGGFVTAAAPEAQHLTQPVKQKDENVSAARFLNLLSFYSGEERYRQAAETAMGYLTSPAVTEAYYFLPGVLQLQKELAEEPVHVTVVGGKDDPAAAALYDAALAYPLVHKRAEWWDRREGKLMHHDVTYPDYPEAAAFACTRNFCSLPVTEPQEIAAQLDHLQRALP